MDMRPLGRSGLKVSVFSLGTMNFGSDWHGIGAIDEKTASSLIDLAMERGVNLLDTADIYGRGAAETMLGRILKRRRDKLLIATKVLGQMDPNDSAAGGLSARWIARALDASLKRLRTDRIDLYMPHGWDPAVPIDETLEALDRAVRAGKVRTIGCSNFSGPQLSMCVRSSGRGHGRVEFDQVQYSLVARFCENDLVPVASAAKVSLVAWSPLAGGLLSGKYELSSGKGRRSHPKAFPWVSAPAAAAVVRGLRRVAILEGVTAAQAALGWILTKPFVASVTLGARSAAQLEETLSSRPLGGRAAELLNRLSAVVG